MTIRNDGGSLSSAASRTEPGSPPAVRPPSLPRDPVLPEQCREDSDAAWGDYPDADDDRLSRDRPPHWADLGIMSRQGDLPAGRPDAR